MKWINQKYSYQYRINIDSHKTGKMQNIICSTITYKVKTYKKSCISCRIYTKAVNIQWCFVWRSRAQETLVLGQHQLLNLVLHLGKWKFFVFSLSWLTLLQIAITSILACSCQVGLYWVCKANKVLSPLCSDGNFNCHTGPVYFSYSLYKSLWNEDGGNPEMHHAIKSVDVARHLHHMDGKFRKPCNAMEVYLEFRSQLECVCCLNLGMSLSYLTSTFSSVKWVYTVPILPTFQCGREVQTDPVWMLPAAFTLYPWPSNCDDVYGGSDQLCPIYLPKLTTWFIDLFLQFQTFEFPQEKRYHQRV